MKLILASASPRRRELLEIIGVVPEVLSPEVDEQFQVGEAAVTAAERLALLKAEAVSSERPDSYVLAADTIVALGDQLLGKPASEPEAMEMLSLLQGRTHEVITGCAIVSLARAYQEVFHVRTEVEFKNCSVAELRAYCASGEPFDKAGGYGIQGKGAALVSKIVGSYTNVVGLPLAEVSDRLTALGLRRIQ